MVLSIKDEDNNLPPLVNNASFSDLDSDDDNNMLPAPPDPPAPQELPAPLPQPENVQPEDDIMPDMPQGVYSCGVMVCLILGRGGFR